MKRLVLAILLLLGLNDLSEASAQPIVNEIDERIMLPSSPNPVGSGARAMGMGGAFIAIADDATAASWNPGGLVQLEKPEMSCVGAFVKRYERTDYAALPESAGKFDIDTANLNYISVAWPFRFLNRNMILSLNDQHLFNFNKRMRLDFEKNYNTYKSQNTYQMNQSGNLYALSPAFAVQVTPWLSLGIAVNLWGNYFHSNSWQTNYSEIVEVKRPSGSYVSNVEHTDRYSFEGLNCNLGFLWAINPVLTLGGVFKSGFEADLERIHSYRFEQNPIRKETVSLFHETMNMPTSFGLGLAMRFSDAFSMGLDIYGTLWDDYYIVTSDGRKISPVSGKAIHETDIDPTTQLRIGMEYLFIGGKATIPLRFGLFYDPEPDDGRPDDFFGMSLGSGLVYKWLAFDMAYQYRFGKNVRAIETGSSFSDMNVDEHSVLCSVVIHL